MDVTIKIIPKSDILNILPLMVEYTDNKVDEAILKERFLEMVEQNYECVGMFFKGELIGIAGLWFMTRHYSGRSVEPDHVYISNNFRRKGLGKVFFDWIHKYAREKGCNTAELNTYVQNYPSHKFYYNEGYEIYGYHFYKTL